MLKPEQVQCWIEQGLPGARATVIGDGHHFEAVIIHAEFAGKTLIQQQRIVHAALKDKMHMIHALSMRTLTPEQV
ncbi:MAG: BolA/IbaG family iron-sulfur metabolism protein [Gammaproteobacteria bacterium]